MDFFFYSLEPKRIKMAILKRKDYGFVIGYYLMLDDYYKRLDASTAQSSSSSSSKKRATLTLVEAPGVRSDKEVINVDGEMESASGDDAYTYGDVDYSEDVTG